MARPGLCSIAQLLPPFAKEQFSGCQRCESKCSIMCVMGMETEHLLSEHPVHPQHVAGNQRLCYITVCANAHWHGESVAQCYGRRGATYASPSTECNGFGQHHLKNSGRNVVHIKYSITEKIVTGYQSVQNHHKSV